MIRSARFLPLALVAAGCGGGGGNVNPPVDPAPISDLRIEARRAGAILDPSNLLLGDVVELRVAGRNGAGADVSVLASGATVTGGGLRINGSQATAIAAGNGAISVPYRGSTLTRGYRVTDPGGGTVLNGRIRADDGGLIRGVTLRFYNAAGTEVGAQDIGTDGTVRAIVPTSARRFDVTFAGTRFYDQFGFNGSDYSSAICPRSAALPTLNAGGTANLPQIVLYRRTGTSVPPPPPSCGS